MPGPPHETAAPAPSSAARALATRPAADGARAAAGLEPPAEPLPGGADLALAPPPLVRVQLPPPGRWRYLGQQTGPGLARPVRAEWHWQQAEGRYDLAFTLWSAGPAVSAPVGATAATTGSAAPPAAPSTTGVAADPRPLWAQTSQGRLQPWGLAPERLEDRRRGRGARAASMVWPGGDAATEGQRGPVPAGRLSFSASTRVGPAWPGLQDRLSWLPQLSGAVAAATAAGAGPVPLRLLVADPSGQVLDWRFEPVPPEAAEGETAGPAAAAVGMRTGTGRGTGLGTGVAVRAGIGTEAGAPALPRWRHTPPTDDGLQVEVWLDPALGHWPRRLRYRWPRTGHQLDLQLEVPLDVQPDLRLDRQTGPPRDTPGHSPAGPPLAPPSVPPSVPPSAPPSARPPDPSGAEAPAARPRR